MTRKQRRFLKAVQILAPGNSFILRVAQSVPAESLPLAPAGAALELVVTLQQHMSPAKSAGSGAGAAKNNSQGLNTGTPSQFTLTAGLEIESAHRWLDLGQPDEASSEVEALPSGSRGHPPAVKARIAARRTVRKTSSAAVLK